MSNIERADHKSNLQGHAEIPAAIPADDGRVVGPQLETDGGNFFKNYSSQALPLITFAGIIKKLKLTDKLLTPIIFLSMILGVIIGIYAPRVQESFDTIQLNGVSVPIAIGLLVMMWPVLTKIQWETLPSIFSARRVWVQIGLSIFLNWVIGPLVMVGLAWATLPDLPGYRVGVILVGLARCIAMVMVWTQLAGGNMDYCAILVVINSILQIVLYAPYSVLFVNVVGGQYQQNIHISYGSVAVSTLIYLGIPLAAGIITRYAVWYFRSKEFLETQFLPIFGPVALIGLVYTIIIMFAYQGRHIIGNIGQVFRVFVPMILYFALMWVGTFALVYYLSKRQRNQGLFGYEMAAVQAFTAGSNNFELAIAVAIAVYGVGSEQALAATIGPLVEVPVLLALTWVSVYFRRKLVWEAHSKVKSPNIDVEKRFESPV